MLINNRAPKAVPTTIPSNIAQKRFSNAPKPGPINICDRLVTSEGMTSIAAAATGDMKAPSIPMATVGNPIPVIPFTHPARRNVKNSKASE